MGLRDPRRLGRAPDHAMVVPILGHRGGGAGPSQVSGVGSGLSVSTFPWKISLKSQGQS